MLNPTGIPHRARSTVSSLFHHFGIHCATHQKRVILISCVVITSLFYPALALYSSSNPVSRLSSRLFDTYQSDLREIWEDHDALRIREDAAARARCGMERTLRIERVLIPSPEWTPTGAATPTIVRFALQLDDRVRQVIGGADSALSCVRTHSNQCLTLSPDLFFGHDVPSTPTDILAVINTPRNVTVARIPITSSMLFSARSALDGHHRTFERVGFLALTYFFHDNDCLASEGHQKWMNTLNTLTDDLGFTSVAPFVFPKPRLIALQYDPTASRPSHFSAISLFLYLAYLIIFVSFSGSLRRMDTVHSRFGLTFTGLIEIMASTVTSVSVCALAGFRVTMVPWGILPVIIVFVGAENMFILVDAVTSTSITLPVKERIGTGLAVAGTSNTLKTVVYNSILGTIAFFSSGAIQQFCSFAIVLLVAHWFLIHTFFVAVLSIDLQRLELSDMLNQDKASKPSVPHVVRKSNHEMPQSKRRQTMSRLKQLLQGRAAKNGSLVMMLAVTATLYYVTYPFPSRPKDDLDPFPFLQHATAVQRPPDLLDESLSPAWDIWNILNPNHDHLVHIRIETPVVVMLNTKESASHSYRTKTTHNYEPMARRSMRPLWLLKIVILPIGTTTGCLYLLLLYLLKDAELLEAQRNRPEGFSDPITRPSLPVEGDVKFSTLPRAFATDVEHLAANHDGTVVAMVSADNELVIWKGKYYDVHVSDILRSNSIESGARACITTVVVDSSGRYCAIGTDSGALALWRLTPQGSPGEVLSLNLANSPSVVEMVLVPVASPNKNEPFIISVPNGDARPEEDLVVVCDNGSAVHFTPSDLTVRAIQPSRPADVQRSRILRTSNHERITIAFTYSDGTVELYSRGDLQTWESNCTLQAGNPADSVVELCQEIVDISGVSTLILGAVTRSGVISLWDPNKRECIFVMGDSFGDVRRLRISSLPSQPCQKCGELVPDGFSLTFSVGHTVFVYRGLISSISKRCACAITKLFPRDNYGGRSRSGSVSSATVSAMRTRLKLSNASASASLALPAFPVSGHGVHPRRSSSEKDTIRRTSETLSVINSQQEELDNPFSAGPSSFRGLQSAPASADSVWRNLVVDQIVDIGCERGGWGLITEQQLMGLRRKSRVSQDNVSKTIRAASKIIPLGELPESVLERWELWTFNPTNPDAGVRVSSLLDLSLPSSPAEAKPSFHPRLPFTRISPVLIRHPLCVLGLGNTTGVVDFSHRSRPS